MKVSYIIGIVMIAIAISILISTAKETSSYENFTSATERMKGGDESSIHVVGTVKKDVNGEFEGIVYEPTVDPNYLEFILIDEEKKEMKVLFNKPMPADFDKSDKIVVIGGVKDNVFVANQILLKCPSKYEENKI